MDFDLRAHTHIMAVAGSRAYGMHTPSSDVDIKGVAIPPKRYVMGCSGGFHQADKPEHMVPFLSTFNDVEKAAIEREKLEGSIFGLQKFMKLAGEANPNILDLLFCRDEEVRLITPIGEKLRENRDLFLSAKAKHTFSGYAYDQIDRIQRHRRWLKNPLENKPEKSDFGIFDDAAEPKQMEAALSMVGKVLDGWELNLSSLEKSTIVDILQTVKKNMAEMSLAADEKWMAAGRTLGMSDNFLVELNKVRAYKSAMNDWKGYQHWKLKRNPERAAMEAKFGYDLKHGAHCVRLLSMSRELLLTGKINIWRGDIDAEWLLSIRAGAWSYEELIDWAERENEHQTVLYNELKNDDNPVIPMKVNIKRISDLCVELHEMAYGY